MENLSFKEVESGLINLKYFKYSQKVLREMVQTIYKTALLLKNDDALHLLKKLNEAKELKNSSSKQNNTPNEIIGNLFYEAYEKLQDKRIHLAKLVKELNVEDYGSAVFANRVIEGTSPVQGLKYDYNISKESMKELFSDVKINDELTTFYERKLDKLNAFSRKSFGNYKTFLADKNENFELRENRLYSEMLGNPNKKDEYYMLGHGKRSLYKYNNTDRHQ